MRRAIALLVTMSAFAISAAAMDIEATVATPNCYAIYIGTATGSAAQLVASNCLPRPMSVPEPGTWSLPDTHQFQVPSNMQVYVVTWARDGESPGVMLQLETGGMCVASGDATWRVYRTGVQRAPADAPPDSLELTSHIREANVSNAWAETYCGGRNDTTADRIVGQIVPEARWMWVPTDGAAGTEMPDVAALQAGECVVFRTEILEIKPEREMFSVAGPGALPYALSSMPHSGHERPLTGMEGSGGGGMAPSGGTSGRWSVVEPELWDTSTYDNPPFDIPDPALPGDPRVPEGDGGWIPSNPETPSDD
ncbi:MAG: hypothetical protein JXO22_01505, partial [Phycisphaerae bacterium]|nr:hypothetical protein [Phycisphaerae bacterium]